MPCDHEFPLPTDLGDRATRCALCGTPALVLYALGYMERKSAFGGEEKNGQKEQAGCVPLETLAAGCHAATADL